MTHWSREEEMTLLRGYINEKNIEDIVQEINALGIDKRTSASVRTKMSFLRREHSESDPQKILDEMNKRPFNFWNEECSTFIWSNNKTIKHEALTTIDKCPDCSTRKGII